MTEKPKPDVRIGQIWQDNDQRAHNRQVRVVDLDGEHAVVELVLPRQVPTLAGQCVTAKPGRRTRIRIDRFRPTSTGYRLVKDVGQTP